jgi:hypothetical protein
LKRETSIKKKSQKNIVKKTFGISSHNRTTKERALFCQTILKKLKVFLSPNQSIQDGKNIFIKDSTESHIKAFIVLRKEI